MTSSQTDSNTTKAVSTSTCDNVGPVPEKTPVMHTDLSADRDLNRDF